MHYNIGEKNPNWKTGKKRDKAGYIYLRKHNRYILEHRLVYEEFYDCCLLRWALVHHINGIKDDNRVENLEVVSKERHNSIHTTMNMDDRFCSICGSKKTYDNIYLNGRRPHWYRLGRDYICALCYRRRKEGL